MRNVVHLRFDDYGLYTTDQGREWSDPAHPGVSGKEEPQIDPPQDLESFDYVGTDTDLEFGERLFIGEDCGSQDELRGFIKRRSHEDVVVENEVQGSVYKKTPKKGYREYENEPSVFIGDVIQSAATTKDKYTVHGRAGFFAVKVHRGPNSTKHHRNGTFIVPFTKRRVYVLGNPRRVSDGKRPGRI